LRRLLVIYLDGYDAALGETMMAGGMLPALEQLRPTSAAYRLEHGRARLTGLAAEHFASGLSPEDSGRMSAVTFDPMTYQIVQEGTRFAPFPTRLVARTVAFDIPYFDLARAPKVMGLSAWGAHDPGTPLAARPASLLDEVARRFGNYSAAEWIYGIAWQSPDRCRTMGHALAEAVATRTRLARWLLEERFPDWELALVGVSEAHSGLEALWHGVDDRHPLHGQPSAPHAAAGVRAIYQAIDRLIGDLAAAFPDADLLVCSMHGMGPNVADIPAMVLLPELLYRHAFGRPFLVSPPAWRTPLPLLGADQPWHVATPKTGSLLGRLRRRLSRPAERRGQSLAWMPAARYRPFWSRMPAFALPAFYDGRIRINLQGRERHGVVPLARYRDACDELTALVTECRDPVTGEPVVDAAQRVAPSDPRDLSETGADLVFTWKGHALAFAHPRLGEIGPVPMRRTGGHTGGHGFAYLRSDRAAPGEHGIRSAFDVAPTIVELAGGGSDGKMSGRSLLAAERVSEPEFRPRLRRPG
jgi:hypothetical protein